MADQRPVIVKQHLISFENLCHPLLSRWAFIKRMATNFGATVILIGLSLAGGMCGYHFLERLPWIDAFTNAAMILSGMGPLDPLRTDAGKLFAGFYALYSGLALILATGILLAPVLHRVIHRLHLQADQESNPHAKRKK